MEKREHELHWTYIHTWLGCFLLVIAGEAVIFGAVYLWSRLHPVIIIVIVTLLMTLLLFAVNVVIGHFTIGILRYNKLLLPSDDVHSDGQPDDDPIQDEIKRLKESLRQLQEINELQKRESDRTEELYEEWG